MTTRAPLSCFLCSLRRASCSAIVDTISDGFREGLRDRGIKPGIPSTKNRKVPLAYDKVLYRQRHRIENAFGRLKDWRRVATRYDRCAHAFFFSDLQRSHHHVGCRNES